MTYTFIARACADLPVAACCRVMRVSTSGFYSWQAEPVRQKVRAMMASYRAGLGNGNGEGGKREPAAESPVSLAVWEKFANYRTGGR